jgi:hypothetical protein
MQRESKWLRVTKTTSFSPGSIRKAAYAADNFLKDGVMLTSHVCDIHNNKIICLRKFSLKQDIL